MKTKNHNIRFNTEKEDECRAWELLHSPQIRQMFKSQNKFVIEAVNDYYDRCVERKDDPYLETREKEDAFAERIVEAVERKVIDPLYYGYAIKAFQTQVEGFAEGSTGQTEINKRRLQDEVVIRFPVSLDEQKAIGRMLKVIDEKIQTNEEVNDNLQEQIRALF